MAELSDADVFGTTSTRKELSDADVFGKSAPKEMSDADVMGSPGVGRYAIEAGKGFAEGAKENVATRLRGYGAGVAQSNRKILDTMTRIDQGETVPEGEDVIGYGQMSPELRQQTRDQLYGNLTRPPAEQPLYQAGETVSQAGQEALKAAPGFEKSWTRAIGSGLGSGIENIVENMIPVAGPLMAVPNMAAAGKGEAVQKAVQGGATVEQQLQAGSLGNVPGLTDLADLLLPKLGPGKAVALVKRVAARVGEGALTEGIQEPTQGLLQNMIEKYTYNPKQDLSEGLLEDAIVGALTGGLISGVAGGHGHERGGTEAQPNAQDEHAAAMKDALDGLRGTPFEPVAQQAYSSQVQGRFAPVPYTSPIFGTPVEHAAEEIRTVASAQGIYEPERLAAAVASAHQEADRINAEWRARQQAMFPSTNPSQFTVETPATQGFEDWERAITYGDVGPERDYRPSVSVVNPATVVSPRLGAPSTSIPQIDIPQGGVAAARPFLYINSQGNVSAVRPVHTSTVGEWLKDVHPVWDEDPTNSVVTTVLKDRLMKMVPNVKVHIVPGSDVKNVIGWGPNEPVPLGVASTVDGSTNLFLNSSIVADPETLAHVVLHEATHAATQIAMAIDPVLRGDVALLMVEANTKLTNDEFFSVRYAFTNSDEFLAEAYSNPRFQHILGNIEISPELAKILKLEGKRPSLWQSIVQLIRRGLNLPENREMLSLLEATMRIGDRIMDAQARMLGSDVRVDNAPYVQGVKENQRIFDQVDKGLEATGRTAATTNVMRPLIGLFRGKGGVPYQVQQAAAHADHFNKIMRYEMGLYQLQRANPNFDPLNKYADLNRMTHLDEVRLQDAGARIGKDWLYLDKQADNLSAFISDLAHMTYRSPIEVMSDTVRHPSTVEFNALVKKHKLGTDALRVFTEMSKFVVGDPRNPQQVGFIDYIGQAVMDRIARRGGPQAAASIAHVQQEIANLKKRPYFPFTNFGRHYILMKDPSGKATHMETVEGNLFKRAKHRQKLRAAELARDWTRLYGGTPTLGPKGDIEIGVLPESAGVLVGMPNLLLEEMGNVLSLTDDQVNAISMLKLLGPTMLDPRFQRKYHLPGYGLSGVRGYSADLRRSFARFMFHGAKFYAKVKYLDQMETVLKGARGFGVKEDEIAAYMERHFQKAVKDARGDWGRAKAFIFNWDLGWSAVAAANNATQTPLITWPFLATMFGEHKALPALIMTIKRSSFKKKGFYSTQTGFEMRAIDYGIKSGRITETQAGDLAAMSQSGLLQGTLRPKAQYRWQQFMRTSPLAFEMMEQLNRRIVFRATLNLAMKNPNNKYVQKALKIHQEEYQRMLAEGWNPAEAQAVIAALDATEQTQGNYSRTARAPFMRGRFSSVLLVFQQYMQSMMTMFAQNPSIIPRYIVYGMLMHGLMGMPGYDEIEALIKWMSRWFGGNFDAERELRRHIVDLFPEHPEDAVLPSELALHGLARYGWGLPAVLDMTGTLLGGNGLGRGLAIPRTEPGPNGEPQMIGGAQTVPFPVLDRSRSVGFGRILPVQLDKLLMPGDETGKVIGDQTAKASGAILNVGFNLYKFLSGLSENYNDSKHYEQTMPRFLKDPVSALRFAWEGRDRSMGGPAGGSTVVPYDVHDTEQLMEVIAKGLGYNSARSQARWDAVIKRQEELAYYKISREGLLKQLYEAVASKVDEDKARVLEAIKKYNTELPSYAKSEAITDVTAEQSVENHFQGKLMREMGLPSQAKDVPPAKEINRIYPGSTIDVRRR